MHVILEKQYKVNYIHTIHTKMEERRWKKKKRESTERKNKNGKISFEIIQQQTK